MGSRFRLLAFWPGGLFAVVATACHSAGESSPREPALPTSSTRSADQDSEALSDSAAAHRLADDAAIARARAELANLAPSAAAPEDDRAAQRLAVLIATARSGEPTKASAWLLLEAAEKAANFAMRELAVSAASAARELAARALPPEDQSRLSIELRLAKLFLALSMVGDAKSLATAVLAAIRPDTHEVVEPMALEILERAAESEGDLLGQIGWLGRLVDCFATRSAGLGNELPTALLNLAGSAYVAGDQPRSQAAARRGIEILLARAPISAEDQHRLAVMRVNLALSLSESGEVTAAREQSTQAVEVFRRISPRHEDYRKALSNHSQICCLAGDVPADRVAAEELLASLALDPGAHPGLHVVALESLASVALLEGDSGQARDLVRESHREIARDHSQESLDYLVSLNNLATVEAVAGGDPATGIGLSIEFSRGLRKWFSRQALSASTREVEELAARMSSWCSILVSRSLGLVVLGDTRGLRAEAFCLIESTRAAGITAAHASRAEGSPEVDRLQMRVRELNRRIASASLDLARRVDPAALMDERDRLERKLLDEFARANRLWPEPTVSAIAARLAPDEVAIGYWRWSIQSALRAATKASADPIDRLCAFIVHPDGVLDLVALASSQAVERAAEEFRKDAMSRVDAPARGLGRAESDEREVGEAAGEKLRKLVVDPLLPRLAGARTWIVALDGALPSVPLDALPLPENRAGVLGDEVAIHVRTSLRELLEERSPTGRAQNLLAVGAIDYAGRKDGPERPAGTSRAITRAMESALFTPLHGTRAEVDGIVRLYGERYTGDAVCLKDAQATREQFVENAPAARFVHVATHGWFSADFDRAGQFPAADPTQLESVQSFARRTLRTTPLVLCGLAFAGANEPDDRGRVTAEELAGLDLSGCELAVLSACDTGSGVLRAGQGVASFRKALQMAGARSVVTSLWPVGDEPSRDLMLEFYARLWVDKKSKRQALWDAKRKLREARDERGSPKYTTRDWAAWVLTGDPD